MMNVGTCPKSKHPNNHHKWFDEHCIYCKANKQDEHKLKQDMSNKKRKLQRCKNE